MVPASAILEFHRSGSRAAFESPWKTRRRNLNLLTAASLPADTLLRYLNAIGDYLWAICEETSWIMSAHLKQHSGRSLPPREHSQIDLGVAMTSLQLATVLETLGSELHPEIVERVRIEIGRRLIDVYLNNGELHWLSLASNWNSVCHCGVLGSAALLSDDETLHRLVEKATPRIAHYLSAFDRTGGTEEGLGYWNYGFEHYCLIDALVSRRGIDTFAVNERVRSIARFPELTELSPGRFMNFSDSEEEAKVDAFLARYLSTRVRRPTPVPVGDPWFQYDLALYNLASLCEPERHSGAISVRRCWSAPEGITLLPDLQWFRLRSPDHGRFVIAGKGGHNGEEHNHNDLGQVIVHVNGKSLLCDLGKGDYVRDSFTERRYEILCNGAFGHSVPIVCGHLQGTGSGFRARVLDWDDSDLSPQVTIDLSAAYPAAAGVRSLRRSVSLLPEKDVVPHEYGEAGFGALIRDQVELAEDGSYEMPFWSWYTPRLLPEANAVEIAAATSGPAVGQEREGELSAIRLEAPGGSLSFEVERFENAVTKAGTPLTAYRIVGRGQTAGASEFTVLVTQTGKRRAAEPAR